MNGLRWCVSYGASWEGLLCWFRLALVALCHSLGKKQQRRDMFTALAQKSAAQIKIKALDEF